MAAFMDITEFVDEATAELELGELLLMPNFALFDAMSAIEIMDPRMDSALVPPGVTPPEVPFTDPYVPLLAEEVCWVLDRTMSAEMGWHSGYALSQTLYTSLYMHELAPMPQHAPFSQYPFRRYDPARPLGLVSIVMQAGIMAIVKTCDMVWRELNKGYVFDLEDYNTDKSDVSLLENIQIPVVLGQLNEALKWLARWQAPQQEWKEALFHRIALRKHILLAVSVDENVTDEPLKRSTHVGDALAAYHLIWAGPVPATPPTSSQLHASFDPTINRRLIVNMPLKVIELMSISRGWEYLHSMLEGMLEVCRMAESPNMLGVMISLRLRARQIPSPNRSAYVRSLNVSLLLQKGTQQSPRRSQSNGTSNSLVRSFCSEIVGLSLDCIRGLRYWPGGDVSVDPAQFAETLERGILQHLLSLCNNRPRMRRSMSKSLALWHKMWEDAVDMAVAVRHDRALKALNRLPLGIRHLRLANLVDLTFAGFEMNLYTPSEWPLIYWHIARVLSLQIQTMETLMRLLQEDSGLHTGALFYARSYITHSKTLRSLSQGTLLTLFIKPPKGLNICNLSQYPTSDEYLLIQRRFKWAFGSHAKPTRYADDARPDLEEWVQLSRKLEAREPSEVAREAAKEFKAARVYSLNLIDQSVWKKAGGAGEQLMNEFLKGCVKVCSAQVSMLEAESDSINAGGDRPPDWAFEHNSWFPAVSRSISNE